MGLQQAPFFCFSDAPSISRSKHTSIHVHTVASGPECRESGLAWKSVGWPWPGLEQDGKSGRAQTQKLPASLLS